ncbi:DUF4229 domain-containing protein [Nocardioides sp. zg-DK7169]|uniref:DUF4229 domain-containing protein n=1 Tax=Nocardioides sp. zg-DK7169 TaxID=2736600 RepID=UPI0015559226|nr:DUF4229 domain-containing protein [Nocardioides sp. zg-DK7169]
MKEFWIYTGLRALLFVAALGVVSVVWQLLTGGVDLFFAVIVAFLISGFSSLVLLDRRREAFALRVQQRADRAAAKFQERAAREDEDER